MTWLWISLGLFVVLSGPLTFGIVHWIVVKHYLWIVLRIFQEKPLFIIPFGQPVPGAEEIELTTSDGLTLHGCYLKTRQPRKGVILFGLEFGSNRWSCVPYTEFLLEEGYDIIAFEPRGQGISRAQPGYEPLQWTTEFERLDFQAALAYLKTRPDRDPRGIGFFGLSKGGSAGLLAAADDDFVRCFVTDGIFATLGTMVPYMKQWIMIYSPRKWLAKLLPGWYYLIVAKAAIDRLERLRNCHYPSIEKAMRKLAPRPLFMIHGENDTYIKPDMARALFDQAREPKTLWLVEKAKHNQSFTVASEEYKRRVLAFFEANLAAPPTPCVSTNGVANGHVHAEQVEKRATEC